MYIPDFVRRLLERVGPQVDDHRPAGYLPDGSRDIAFGDGEVDFPVVPADGVQLAALAEVIDFLARAFPGLALEVRQEVVAIRMNLEGLALAW